MDIVDLHNAIVAVCPVTGVAVIDPNDKATWRIDFASTATAVQQAAARNVVANFDVILEAAKAAKKSALDALLDNNFDLKAFIRAGTVTGITGANVGNFLAQICNNYRTLRAAIAAAADVAALNAINVNAGWPSNP